MIGALRSEERGQTEMMPPGSKKTIYARYVADRCRLFGGLDALIAELLYADKNYYYSRMDATYNICSTRTLRAPYQGFYLPHASVLNLYFGIVWLCREMNQRMIVRGKNKIIFFYSSIYFSYLISMSLIKY
jgi:hypothetical protein